MNVFRKAVVVSVLGVVIAAGMASANLLDRFGSITGEASVEPSLEIVEVNANTPVSRNGGEYILFENNLGAIEASEWRVNQSNIAVQELDEVSRDVIEAERFALADEDADFSGHENTDFDQEGIKIFELESVLGGMPAEGDTLYLKIGDSVTQRFEYGECEEDKASVGSESCVEPSIEVSPQ